MLTAMAELTGMQIVEQFIGVDVTNGDGKLVAKGSATYQLG